MTLQTNDFFQEIEQFVHTVTVTERARLVRSIVTDVMRSAVAATPVDTGLLKSNWQISYSGEAEVVGIRDDPVGAELPKLKAAHLIKRIFIVNPVYYAVYIEFGTDRISPQFMLTQALESGYELR